MFSNESDEESKGHNMDKEIQEKLASLVSEIDNGMDPKSGRPIKLTKQKSKMHHKVLELKDLTGALDDLKLGIKYLVFDLEATRRENSYLKQQIKDLS